ncbi:MAG: linear amide C-N hydrolase [Thermoanaerobaculales bacterium]|jgi:choloylglycine hydrolase|nr:linear amide C-N hydrolase [Thermoanaerobaculales bacterium]
MRSATTSIVCFAFLLSAIVPAIPADACTSFLIKHPDGPLMAKNYDWDVADGFLVVNPRSLSKTALVAEGLTPVRWSSRYGSVTFNQYGREFPLGGMNEVGLAMEVLWLDGTEYPDAAGRRSIGTLQWVQYCLDSYRSVDDVVASASELAISGTASVHFLACDATANCAVIEFLDGTLVSRSERTLPLPVLTNNTFAESLDYLNLTLGYGGEPVEPKGTGSLARFARAANGSHRARTTPGGNRINDAFAVLADVAQPDSTQWSIVYDLRGRTVHYRTAANPKTRTFTMRGVDLECSGHTVVADLLADGEGPAVMKPFSGEANRAVIEAAFAAEALKAPAPEVIDAMATYSDHVRCIFEPHVD